MNKHSKDHPSEKPQEETHSEAKTAQQPQNAQQAKQEKPAETPKEDAAKKAANEIEALKKALAEAEDKRLRTIAEMDNLRKRLAKDLESQRFMVQADTLSAFLQVFDHFSMAVKASTASNNLKALLDGMKMIDAEFARAFQELGVEFVNAEGKDFDPNLHEALSEEKSDKIPAGKVLRQWNSACKLGQRLLRPARVVVSSGPAKPEESQPAASTETKK